MHESAGHSPHMYVLYTCFFSFPPIARECLIEEIATVQSVHRILTYFNSCIGIYSIEGNQDLHDMHLCICAYLCVCVVYFSLSK